MPGIGRFVKDAFEESLSRILNKRQVDVLHDIELCRKKGKPYVIVFCGVNGVGKSTNLAKICYWLGQHNFKVLLAACDTFRSGAVEQLQTHARRLGVSWQGRREGGREGGRPGGREEGGRAGGRADGWEGGWEGGVCRLRQHLVPPLQHTSCGFACTSRVPCPGRPACRCLLSRLHTTNSLHTSMHLHVYTYPGLTTP